MPRDADASAAPRLEASALFAAHHHLVDNLDQRLNAQFLLAASDGLTGVAGPRRGRLFGARTADRWISAGQVRRCDHFGKLLKKISSREAEKRWWRNRTRYQAQLVGLLGETRGRLVQTVGPSICTRSIWPIIECRSCTEVHELPSGSTMTSQREARKRCSLRAGSASAITRPD
jgi:hypothetical protein